jgi:hypothetical protein
MKDTAESLDEIRIRSLEPYAYTGISTHLKFFCGGRGRHASGVRSRTAKHRLSTTHTHTVYETNQLGAART